MALVNYTEKVVQEHLNEYISKHPQEFCTCQHCQEDILALALNSLPPKYVSSIKGEIIAQFKFLEPLDKTRVLTELVKAIQTVANNPAH